MEGGVAPIFSVRTQRLFISFWLCIAFLVLLLANGQHFFAPAQVRLSALNWISFCLATVTSVLFFSVGLTVWMYARSRRVAGLVCAFSLLMSYSFASQSSATTNDPLFSAIGTSSLALALPCLLHLVAIFPEDYLSFSPLSKHPRSPLLWLRQGYAFVLTAMGSAVALYAFSLFFSPHRFPSWLRTGVVLYFALIVVTILLLMILSFTRRTASSNSRLQSRLLLLGVTLSFAPVLLFTLVPLLLHRTELVSGQLSTVTIGVLPLAIGYAVLRQQVLLRDRVIQVIASVVISAICMLGLLYLSLNLLDWSLSALHHEREALVAPVLILVAVFSPCILYIGDVVTRRVLFKENGSPLRLFATQNLLSASSGGLDALVKGVSEALQNEFQIATSCLFVLRDEADHQHCRAYELVPPLASPPLDAPRRTLLQLLHAEAENEPVVSTQDEKREPLCVRLVYAPPTSTTVQRAAPDAVGFIVHVLREFRSNPDRVLLGAQDVEVVPHLFPVWWGQVLIGILAVGEPTTGEPFGGPDAQRVMALLSTLAPLLEMARTEQRRTQALQSAIEQEHIANHLKDQFLLTTSHELRTPLTAVVGYLELLDDKNNWNQLPEERKQTMVSRALQSATELMHLMEALMEGNREVEKRRLLVRPVSLYSTLTALLKSQEYKLVAQSRTVQLQLPLDMVVLADELALKQIIGTLLDNALKYSPDATDIVCRGERDGHGSVVLHISDFGPGIPPGARDLIFERFIRLDRELNSPRRGVGLGLYICRQLAERMQGQLTVTSTGIAGEGSTFTLVLPESLSAESDLQENVALESSSGM